MEGGCWLPVSPGGSKDSPPWTRPCLAFSIHSLFRKGRPISGPFGSTGRGRLLVEDLQEPGCHPLSSCRCAPFGRTSLGSTSRPGCRQSQPREAGELGSGAFTLPLLGREGLDRELHRGVRPPPAPQLNQPVPEALAVPSLLAQWGLHFKEQDAPRWHRLGADWGCCVA